MCQCIDSRVMEQMNEGLKSRNVCDAMTGLPEAILSCQGLASMRAKA